MKKHSIISAILIASAMVITANASCLVNPNQKALTDTIPPDSVVKVISNPLSATLIAVGDNLYDWYMLEAGKKGNSYNFDHNYDNIKPYVALGDLRVINQETPLGGDNGYKASDVELKDVKPENRWGSYHGYAKFNSPDAVGHAVVNAGFNVITMATNHIFDHGMLAVQKSAEFWETNYPDIPVIGIHKDASTVDTVIVVEKNNIKFALLNYTYGVNEDGQMLYYPYATDILNEEKIRRDVAKAKQLADFVIVFPHWGTEYKLEADESQKKFAQIFLDCEVDVVIGSHPHIVEPMEWLEKDNGHRMLVYYSLGNFISMFKNYQCQLEGMAFLKFEKDGDKKSITEGSIIPLVNHWKYDLKIYGYRNNFTVYALKDYTETIAKTHGCLHYKGGAGFSAAYMRQLANEIWGGFIKEGY